MNVQTIGSRRPKLTLPFGGRKPSGPAIASRSPTLSGHELRRIVSEMIG